MSILKNLIYRIKLNMTRNKSNISDMIVSSDVLGKIDDDVAMSLEEFETDDEKIVEFRKENSADIIKLRNTLIKIDNKSKPEILSKISKDTQKYTNYISKEIKDVEKIINLSAKIIDNEHLSVLYDVRRPLNSFLHYQDTLVKNLKKVAIPYDIKNTIVDIFMQTTNDYKLVIKYTMDLAHNINFDEMRDESEGLVHAIKHRTYAKKALSGKTLSIYNNLKKLEKYFEEFKKLKILNAEEADILLKNLSEFKNNFSQLTNFCKNRIDASGIIIKEARTLQNKKYEELVLLEQEISQIVDLATKNNKTDKLIDTARTTHNKAMIVLLKQEKKQVKKLENKEKKTERREDSYDRIIINQLNRDSNKLETNIKQNIKKIEHSSTLLDKFRNKTLTWVVTSAMALQIGIAPIAPFIKSYGSNNEKFLLVGSYDQLKKVLEENNVDISPNILQEKKLINKVIEKQVIVFEDFKLSSNFVDVIPTNEDSTIQNLEKNLLGVDSYIRENVEREMKRTLKEQGLSNEEINNLIETSMILDVQINYNNSLIEGYSSPEGAAGETNSRNNTILSQNRADSFKMLILDQFNKSNSLISKNVIIDSLRQIPTKGKGTFHDNKDFNKIINLVNKYVHNMNKEELNKFFENNFTGYKYFLDDPEIDYKKIVSGDRKEDIKFDVFLKMMKVLNPEKHKEVENILKKYRFARLVLDLKIVVEIYGSEDTPTPIVIIPTPQSIQNSPYIFNNYTNKKNKYYIPRTIGKTSGSKENIKKYGIPRGESRKGGLGPRYTNRSGR